MQRTVVVVPIKEGARDALRELVEHEPPFDPGSVVLQLSYVFVTAREVVFVIEGAESLSERVLCKAVLAAAHGWREYVVGPPRVGEDVFSWERVGTTDGVFFLPTPGPGDSDGGDLYAP